MDQVVGTHVMVVPVVMGLSTGVQIVLECAKDAIQSVTDAQHRVEHLLLVRPQAEIISLLKINQDFIMIYNETGVLKYGKHRFH